MTFDDVTQMAAHIELTYKHEIIIHTLKLYGVRLSSIQDVLKKCKANALALAHCLWNKDMHRLYALKAGEDVDQVTGIVKELDSDRVASSMSKRVPRKRKKASR